MRSSRLSVFVCWLAVCNATQWPFTLKDNIPHQLSDGLLITRDSDINVRKGTYTVLVVIDAPQPEPRLAERLFDLRAVIRELGKHQNYSRTTHNVWEQRIADIEATMATPQSLPITRIKRGLFNFVGEIGATLFGTATEDQVEELKRQIVKAQRTNRRIVHTTYELISVVNQTRAEVTLNRQHLIAVEKFAKELYNELMSFRKGITGLVGSLVALEQSSQIDQILSALESVHNLWLRKADRYRRQRASLELGQLTEEIVPPKELLLILEASQGVGLFSPGLAWYYQHVSLVPVWEETQRLVFTAQLPLMDKIRYARYRIRSWPVPANGSDHTLTVQIPDDVAVDTQRGGIFEPHDCAGNDSAICRSGPIYGKGRLLCTRGILNGDDTQRASCLFTAARETSPAGYAEEVAPALYVISTYGEGYSLHCRGKSEKRHTFEVGLYLLRVAADCRVQGRDWTLPGVAHLQAQLAVAPDILTHLPLNITTLIPQELLQTRLEHPDWQALPQVEDITLEKLNARLPSWTLETVGRRSSFRWVLPLSFLSPVALVVACALLLWWKCPATKVWKLRRTLHLESVKPPSPSPPGEQWIALTQTGEASAQV